MYVSNTVFFSTSSFLILNLFKDSDQIYIKFIKQKYQTFLVSKCYLDSLPWKVPMEHRSMVTILLQKVHNILKLRPRVELVNTPSFPACTKAAVPHVFSKSMCSGKEVRVNTGDKRNNSSKIVFVVGSSEFVWSSTGGTEMNQNPNAHDKLRNNNVVVSKPLIVSEGNLWVFKVGVKMLRIIFRSGKLLNFSNFPPKVRVEALCSWVHRLLAWLAPHSWLSELLTHLCLQALYQPASQPTDQPALLTNWYLICAAIGGGADYSSVSAAHCQLQTAEGLAVGLSGAELVLFIDGVKGAVNILHQIRLMGEKSEMCSGGEMYLCVFGRVERLPLCVWVSA